MKLLFTLGMPNVGSWNGTWGSEKSLHARIRTFRKTKSNEEKIKKLVESGYFYYNFGDGWGASVTVTIPTDKDVLRVKKHSIGFAGYDWMIDSILSYGEILNSAQQKKKDESVNAD